MSFEIHMYHRLPQVKLYEVNSSRGLLSLLISYQSTPTYLNAVLRKVWFLRLPCPDTLNLMTSAMRDTTRSFACCQVATQEHPAFRTSGGAELDSRESTMHNLANIADDPVSSRSMAELIFDRHSV